MSTTARRADDIEAALKGIHIPSCPNVLAELMAELRQPQVSGKRIAALIGKDVGLAAVVVKSANSPFFGVSRRIASVDEAIRLLGFGTLTNLVQEATLRNAISDRNASLERFWDNSRYTAAASALFARKTGSARPETAYTFGLFHDCGIPLLVQRFDNYKQILGIANQATERWFTAVEDEALDTNHATIGYLLARSWGLTEAVCQGILCHHDYSVLDGDAGLDAEARALIAINVVGEYVAGTHLRTRRDAEWDKGREPVARFLGYSPAELDDIADDLVYAFDCHTRDEAA
ncbi:MAG TPA: HDOD domain-containing protein [Thauera sp.]|uniref:HDOD domain-containing protein n=1 Tax=Thauera sp. TaxID=1905334 RepID=UPI002BCEF8AD|nr:HDOD domain-containing protein [Thauera sp.]HRP23706.1 HDOD domain-containing protein [Thauera sp.]HRP64892.1 HDOD domain-containing protein [Thauera sp.]